MITIKTKVGDVGLVEVPKLAFYFDWGYCTKHDSNNNPKIQIYWEAEDDGLGGIITNFIKSNQFEILDKLSQLDKELEEFVELTNTGLFKMYNWTEDKIKADGIQPITTSSKKSFISLLESEGIDTSKEYLVIKIL